MVAISSLHSFPERGIASERMCNMINASKVQKILFEWGRARRRRNPPSVIDSIFTEMMTGRLSFPDLCKSMIAQIQERNGQIDMYRIASVIAALYVLHPRSAGINRSTVIDQLVLALGRNIERQSPFFYHGCVLGLFLAVNQLGEGEESCSILEAQLWSRVFELSQKADLPESNRVEVDQECSGVLSNLLSDYFRSKSLSRQSFAQKAILVDLPDVFQRSNDRSSEKAELLLIDGMTQCIVGELVYKIFGNLSLGEKLEVIDKHLKRELVVPR